MSNVQHSHKNETFHAKAAKGRSGDEVSKKPQRSSAVSAREFAKLISPPHAICNA
jgi:hypothetical protein